MIDSRTQKEMLNLSSKMLLWATGNNNGEQNVQFYSQIATMQSVA